MTALLAFLRSDAAKYILVAVALFAFLGGLIWWATRAQDKAVTQARDAGAATQRSTDLETTLERTKEANHAREEIRSGTGSARYDECLRSAGSTAANCQRFLPQ